MKVLQMVFLVDDYQQLFCVQDIDPKLRFHGDRKLPMWTPVDVYVLDPMLRPPDLWACELSTGVFAVSERAESCLATFLEMASELLPLSFTGKTINLVNITEVLNCLDYSQCDGTRDANGNLFGITTSAGTFYAVDKFAFFPDRFTESTLFKVPYSPRIFALERSGEPDEEFKAAVEHHGLEGVEFIPVWDERVGTIDVTYKAGVRTLYCQKNGKRVVYDPDRV